MSFITANRPSAASAVTGPGSSTDNAVARWDGASGTIVQNSGVIIDDSNNVTGVGSLTVTTLIATTTITTGDNIIRLNDDVAGAPTENAGIEVERGASTDASLLWDETSDFWKAGLVGSEARLITAADSTTLLPEGSNLYFTDERAQDAVGGALTDSTSVDFTYTDGSNQITADIIGLGPVRHTNYAEVFDDFGSMDGSTFGELAWADTTTGTGATIQAAAASAPPANFYGVAELDTGTTATGKSSMQRPGGVSNTYAGIGTLIFKVRVAVPTLSTVGEEYALVMGFTNNLTPASITNGVWFLYDRVTYGDVWVLQNASSGTTTTTATATAVAANTWFTVRAEHTGSAIAFYVDNVLVGTHSTNIPSGIGQAFRPMIQIIKSAGTTDRTFLVDYWYEKLTFSTPRL